MAVPSTVVRKSVVSALVLSFAVNAALVGSRWTTGHHAAGEISTRRDDVSAPMPTDAHTVDGTGTVRAALDGDEQCRDELARCRDQSWALVRSAIVTSARSVAAPRPPTDAGLPVDIGPREQRAALCEHTLSEWADSVRADRARTIANLRVSLADAAEQDRNAAQVAGEMADALALGADQRAALANEYRTLRIARMQALLDAISQDPPQIDAATAAARGLFTDEDALVAQYAGAAGRIAWRQRESVGRSTILAMGAAMGNHPLDDAIGW